MREDEPKELYFFKEEGNQRLEGEGGSEGSRRHIKVYIGECKSRESSFMPCVTCGEMMAFQ